jgi:hypothetical protein
VRLLWWGENRDENPPRGSLCSSLCSPPLLFSSRTFAASIWLWVRFLSFYWDAIAVDRRRFCIYLFKTFLLEVTTTAPQTSRGLLVVRPDMTKVLAVLAMRKASPTSV